MANAQVQYDHPPPEAIGATLNLDPDEAQYLYDLFMGIGLNTQNYIADHMSSAHGSRARLKGAGNGVRNRLAAALGTLVDSGLIKHYEAR